MELDWQNAQPRDDELRVPLRETPDPVWAHTFDQSADLWGRETRGQTWEGVQLEADGRGVVVYGISAGTQKDAVRTYVDQLVRLVNEQAPRERQRIEAEAADQEQRTREASDATRRLADEFREGED